MKTLVLFQTGVEKCTNSENMKKETLVTLNNKEKFNSNDQKNWILILLN